MAHNVDWVMWLLATICFGIGALSGMFVRADGTPAPSVTRVNLMLLGFMFIAITFLV